MMILIILQSLSLLWNWSDCQEVINIADSPIENNTYVCNDITFTFPNGCADGLVFHGQNFANPDSIVVIDMYDNVIFEMPMLGAFFLGASIEGYVQIIDNEIYNIDDLPTDWKLKDHIFGAYTFFADYPFGVKIKFVLSKGSAFELLVDCNIERDTVTIVDCFRNDIEVVQECNRITTYVYKKGFTKDCVPNIFTKNQCIELKSYFYIFDRWGNEIYKGYNWCGSNIEQGVYTIHIPGDNYIGTITYIE